MWRTQPPRMWWLAGHRPWLATREGAASQGCTCRGTRSQRSTPVHSHGVVVLLRRRQPPQRRRHAALPLRRRRLHRRRHGPRPRARHRGPRAAALALARRAHAPPAKAPVQGVAHGAAPAARPARLAVPARPHKARLAGPRRSAASCPATATATKHQALPGVTGPVGSQRGGQPVGFAGARRPPGARPAGAAGTSLRDRKSQGACDPTHVTQSPSACVRA